MRLAALALLAPTLVACADPATEQAARDYEKAKLTVLGDAMFYWKCIHQGHQFSGECRPWREAYERDYAAFIAKYGPALSRRH